MANSYAMNAGNMYSQGGGYQPVRKNSGPSVFGMMTLGAVGGGAVGYFKNRYPIGKDGAVADSFAREVFDKNLNKNCSSDVKKYFKQLKEVLNKIDKVKTPEEYRKLINANKYIIEEQCKAISSETLLDAVNTTNIKTSKEALKKSLEGIMDFELLKTKNAVKLGWNSESKKFIKSSEFKDAKLFDIIKNTKSNMQWKKALKYGGITAGVMGALTVGYKMLANKS